MLSFSTLHIIYRPKRKNYRIYQLSNQKQHNPKKNLGNEPREVDVGLANPGNFTLTVLRWAVTDQRGRNVGLASMAGWTWKRMEEEWLSESEVVRVGENECLRGAMTMRWVRPWDCDSDGLREAVAVTMRMDENENGSLSVLLWGWGAMREASCYWTNEGLGLVIALSLYI